MVFNAAAEILPEGAVFTIVFGLLRRRRIERLLRGILARRGRPRLERAGLPGYSQVE